MSMVFKDQSGQVKGNLAAAIPPKLCSSVVSSLKGIFKELLIMYFYKLVFQN